VTPQLKPVKKQKDVKDGSTAGSLQEEDDAPRVAPKKQVTPNLAKTQKDVKDGKTAGALQEEDDTPKAAPKKLVTPQVQPVKKAATDGKTSGALEEEALILSSFLSEEEVDYTDEIIPEFTSPVEEEEEINMSETVATGVNLFTLFGLLIIALGAGALYKTYL